MNILDKYLSTLYLQVYNLPRNQIWAGFSKLVSMSFSSALKLMIPNELIYNDKKLDGILLLLEYAQKYFPIIHQKGRVSPFLLGSENRGTLKDLEELSERIDLVPFFASLIPHVSKMYLFIIESSSYHLQ